MASIIWLKNPKFLRLALLALVFGGLSGCETLNPLTIGVGLVSYATTGKGLADHAIGTLTQQDCNILGGILNSGRRICEPIGSAAANTGFHGLFASAHDVTPDLRLSDTLEEPAVADFDSAEQIELARGPRLRLSTSITPVAPPTPGRLAALTPGRLKI